MESPFCNLFDEIERIHLDPYIDRMSFLQIKDALII